MDTQKRFSRTDIKIATDALRACGIEGELQIELAPNVYANLVFKAKHVASGQRYAVHLRSRFSRGALENERSIAQQLQGTPLRTAPIVPTKEGRLFYKSQGVSAVVSKWMNGRHAEAHDIPLPMCELFGTTLALFHTRVKHLPQKNNNKLLDENTLGQWKKGTSGRKYGDTTKELREVAEQLNTTVLPRGLIHGDFHVFNVLLENDAINVLDLEYVGSGILLFDIARAALSICSIGNKFSTEKSAAFLKGYERVRPMKKCEHIMYRPAVAFSALALSNRSCRTGSCPGSHVMDSQSILALA